MDKPPESANEAQARRCKRIQIYQSVFSTDDGLWVLKDLCKRYDPLQHDGGGKFLSGQRSVTAEIVRIMKSDIVEQIELLNKLPKELYE